MNTVVESSPAWKGVRHELDALRGHATWFLAAGIVLVVLGGLAISSATVASLATVVFLGALILMSGIAETIGSFWCRGWSGFFLHLLSGILSIVVGMFFLRAPVGPLLVLTLLVAAFLMVGGIFKIIAATHFRFAAWGWPLFNGVIDLVLGVMIWLEWPASALWVIGLFVGINILFRGFNWIALGLAMRSMSTGAAGEGRP